MNKLQQLYLDNILDIGIFLLLCFIGVIARLSYDSEVKKTRFKLSSIVNRFFITSVCSYIIEIFITNDSRFRPYYSQIILLFSIFVMDIIQLILKYKDKIALYLIKLFVKGMTDVADSITKKDDKE